MFVILSLEHLYIHHYNHRFGISKNHLLTRTIVFLKPIQVHRIEPLYSKQFNNLV